ncbi:MAG: hypothetical protein N2039_12395 [Gemmataceae bacterium]|nr:hypothetical protein [Gemmataceae bacterium]
MRDGTYPLWLKKLAPACRIATMNADADHGKTTRRAIAPRATGSPHDAPGSVEAGYVNLS